MDQRELDRANRKRGAKGLPPLQASQIPQLKIDAAKHQQQHPNQPFDLHIWLVLYSAQNYGAPPDQPADPVKLDPTGEIWGGAGNAVPNFNTGGGNTDSGGGGGDFSGGGGDAGGGGF